jgi:putative ABC transport system substrate-binding protein
MGRSALALITLALSLLVAPLAAHAQQPSKVPRVGVLAERSPADPSLAAFRQGLRELGWVEGQNLLIEYRYAHGEVDQFPTLVAELLDLNVDVLVVAGTVAAQAAKARTSTVPIVFTVPGDPVGAGLVASLARPGGNATGLSSLVADLSGKHLEFLKTAVPQVARVAVLYNPVNPSSVRAVHETREAAWALAVELHVVEVRQPHELASAFAALTVWRAEALLTISDPVFGPRLAELAQMAATHRLPAIYVTRAFAEVGGLLAYGPSWADNFRRAATYVDKVLKGAKPADLPVEQPMKFELVINLKTAQALGLTIPPTLLFQADEVIR